MIDIDFEIEHKLVLKKFCNIAGRGNAAKWALKKYLATIDSLLENNDYNCGVIQDIRNAVSRKANSKQQYVTMPKWERLVARAKREISSPNDSGLSGYKHDVYTHKPKKGEQKFEIIIKKPEPEYHSPHVHIICGKYDATILMSNPEEIDKGTLPKGVLEIAVDEIKKRYNSIIKEYNELNGKQVKKEKRTTSKKQAELKKKR